MDQGGGGSRRRWIKEEVDQGGGGSEGGRVLSLVTPKNIFVNGNSLNSAFKTNFPPKYFKGSLFSSFIFDYMKELKRLLNLQSHFSEEFMFFCQP